MSRKEISSRLGLHPNIVGQVISEMLDEGLAREGPTDTLGRGRPRIPLEIDPDRRCLLAASINQSEVSVCRINLLGQVIGNSLSKSIRQSLYPAEIAADLLQRLDGEATLGFGISVSGFINPDDRRTLSLSSVSAKGCSSDLSPLYAVVGDRPLVFENDMHALAAQWALDQGDESQEHILLVLLRDGALGAAVLVDGKPNHGGVAGCNELGHMRFFVDTEPCYCGHTGCLERICSTDFLRLHGASREVSFESAVAEPSPSAQVLRMVDYLSAGLSNAINFIRPERLVIASPYVQERGFIGRLQRGVRKGLLSPISDRLQIDLWALPDSQPSVKSLGKLGLAPIYLENWPTQEMAGKVATEATLPVKGVRAS